VLPANVPATAAARQRQFFERRAVARIARGLCGGDQRH